MTVLTLSEVSKQFKLNRSTIYRSVSSGRLSRRADGYFDLAEVIRCFGEPKNIQPKRQGEVSKPTLISQDGELDRLRQDFSEYRRKAEEREEWLKSQLDRMQTLLEMKSTVAAAPQQQVEATKSDMIHAISETAVNTTSATGETLHATPQQQPSETLRNTADATGETLHATPQQQPSETLRNTADATLQRRSLFGRVIRAFLDS